MIFLSVIFCFINILNNVFNKKSIVTFNNTLFNSDTIGEVTVIHPTIERLYLAAKELRDVSGQSAVARLLGKTPQVVKNWEARGISSEGALLVQKIIGCDANWLLDGEMQMKNAHWGPKSDEQQAQPAPLARQLHHVQILKGLAAVVAQIDPANRDNLAPMLSALVMGPDSQEIIDKITNYIENASLKKRGAPEFGAHLQTPIPASGAPRQPAAAQVAPEYQEEINQMTQAAEARRDDQNRKQRSPIPRDGTSGH